MKINMYKTILIIILGLSFNAVAEDGNNALYDPVAPKDSVFIRVANFSDSQINVLVRGKEGEQSVPSLSVGGYIFAEQGEVSVKVNDKTYTSNLEPRSVITLIYMANELVVVEDAFFESRRKSRVSFYNFYKDGISLKTSDGKIGIIENLKVSESAQRELNEVKIAMAVYDASTLIGSYEQQLYKKGRSYSFFVLKKNKEAKLLLVPDSIDPII